MKYRSDFENWKGDCFELLSMDDYTASAEDIAAFTKVVSDDPVRNYITDKAMKTWNHETLESLARDILVNSATRWNDRAELRFLVRNSFGVPVGMIGINPQTPASDIGELWFFKTSAVPAFIFEALLLVFGFAIHEGVCSFVAEIEPSNTQSRKLLSRLGFLLSSEQPDHVIMGKRIEI